MRSSLPLGIFWIAKREFTLEVYSLPNQSRQGHIQEVGVLAVSFAALGREGH
jgi:hypothetical protein